MADSTSVPLWFSGLTFFGGLLSSQLLELWKDYRGSNRERESRREARAIIQADRRTQFQRETLLELQDKCYEAAKTLSDITVHHNVQLAFGVPRTSQPAADEYKRHTESLWRLGLLGTRLRSSDVYNALALFTTALGEYREDLSSSALDVLLSKVRNAYAGLMKSTGTALKEIDDVELASVK